MITIMSKEKLEAFISNKVSMILRDEQIRRTIAMEYLITLKKTELNTFLDAVELRKKSEVKLAKLDEQNPDIDKAIDNANDEYIQTEQK